MIAKIRANIRAMGWRDTAYYALSRALAAFGLRLFRYDLVAQPVAGAPLLPGRRGASITVRRMLPGDAGFRGLPLDDRVLAFRFDQRAVCLGAFRDQRVVGCLWMCLDGYQEDEVRCRFVPDPPTRASWDFDVYVDPAHRAGFVFARLWDAANEFLRGRGIEWSMSRISRFNAASVASHRALGAVSCAQLVVIKAGNWQLSFATIPPRIHLSLRVDTMPMYRISAPQRRAAGPRAHLAA